MPGHTRTYMWFVNSVLSLSHGPTIDQPFFNPGGVWDTAGLIMSDLDLHVQTHGLDTNFPQTQWLHVSCNRINRYRIGWRENVPETVSLWRSTMVSCNLSSLKLIHWSWPKRQDQPGFLLEFCHHHGQFRRQCVQIRQSPVHLGRCLCSSVVSRAQIGGTYNI